LVDTSGASEHCIDTGRTHTISTRDNIALQPDPGPLFSLVIQHAGGTKVTTLHPGAPLIIGRAPSHGLRVEHGTLSREHARFELVGDRVVVTDLGSKNGVLLEQRRTQQAELAAGEAVMLGAVCVRVQLLGLARQALEIEDEREFARKVEEALAHANTYRRSLGVLSVRAAKICAGSGAWIDEMKRRLSTIDHLACYGPSTALVLLPDLGLADATRLARVIVAPPSPAHVQLCAGLAVHAGGPEATTVVAETLIESARQAAQQASPANQVQITDLHRAAFGSNRVTKPDAHDVVGAHMRALLDDVERVASSRIPVILYGETGTGKEVLARSIHERSPRRSKRIVCVNCGAIPRDLVESTLFGHERGAFTGAQQQQKGVFEEANSGTVFLDEIGELPLSAQAALLRVLETGSFNRVGAAREVMVDVRIIAATHRNLETMVRDGTFRADLYYRLSGAILEIAPLRDRIEDVEPLAMRFLSGANKTNGRTVQGITRDAVAVLCNYGWPGNVRELRNVIERAVVITTGALIDVRDLPLSVREARTPSSEPAHTFAAASSTGVNAIRGTVRSYEAAKLREALEAAGWNRGEAAQKLEMPVRTLSYRMKVLGLKKPLA
jgi:DNA-binding NtrC family response regulator